MSIAPRSTYAVRHYSPTQAFVLILFLLLFNVYASFAQSNNVNACDTTLHDADLLSPPQKIALLISQCQTHRQRGHRCASNFGRTAVALSIHFKFDSLLKVSLIALADAHLAASDFDSALLSFNKSLTVRPDKDDSLMAAGLLGIGTAYLGLCDYANALHFLMSAMTRQQKAGLPTSRVLIMIGRVHCELRDYTSALRYLFESLQVTKKHGDMAGMSLAYNQIEIIYRETGDLVKATDMRAKAISIDKKLNDMKRLAIDYSNLGELYLAKGQLDSAINWLQQSILIHRELDDEGGQALAYYCMSKAFLQRQAFTHADSVARLSYKLACRAKARQTKMKALHLLYTVNKSMQRTDEALEFYERYHLTKDSILSADNARIIARLEYKFQTRQRRSENELLRLRAFNQAATISKQRNQLFIVVPGMILLLLLVTLSHITFRLKRRANKMLQDKNSEIKTQNEELLQTLEQLKNAQSHLIHSEKMASLGMLTAGIAHEINNPVTFIAGGVQALEQTIDEMLEDRKNLNRQDLRHEMEDLFRSIKVGVKRTTDIVRDLKSFARSDEKVKTNVNVNECVTTTLTILNTKIRDKVIVEKELSPGVIVNGYSGQINQVLLNIIDNAIYAATRTDRIPKVAITTSREKDYVLICIADNGYGIPEHIRNSIFDPFFTTKGVGEGTGLGMTISYNIITSLGGGITFRSSDKGTDFFITIPLVTKDDSPENTDQSSPSNV